MSESDLPEGHTYVYYEDIFPYCECGKSLEPGYYEHEDHVRSLRVNGCG